jgi:hypothetical protein
MRQERSNYPKFQNHEKALSTSEVVCRSGKLSGMRKGDQSLFSLLLEIESRLGTEHRNDQIEQLKRSKEKDRQRSRVNLNEVIPPACFPRLAMRQATKTILGRYSVGILRSLLDQFGH